MISAQEKLKTSNNELKYVCVGLDPDQSKLPAHLKSSENSILKFNQEIIDSTKDLAVAYKLNFAFYEKEGISGFEILKKTIEFIPQNILIIGDAKRGDIGNTARMYAKSIYDYFNCDAATVNPYMGGDSISPFLEYPEKINFILVLTSNPGADDLEKLKLEDGTFVFQNVCKKVEQLNKNNNCGIVFGATKLKELEENFKCFTTFPVLLPGIGAQGGDLGGVVSAFKKNNKKDFLINVSRGILYKSNGADFAEAARNELISMNTKIQEILKS